MDGNLRLFLCFTLIIKHSRYEVYKKLWALSTAIYFIINNRCSDFTDQNFVPSVQKLNRVTQATNYLVLLKLLLTSRINLSDILAYLMLGLFIIGKYRK